MDIISFEFVAKTSVTIFFAIFFINNIFSFFIILYSCNYLFSLFFIGRKYTWTIDAKNSVIFGIFLYISNIFFFLKLLFTVSSFSLPQDDIFLLSSNKSTYLFYHPS